MSGQGKKAAIKAGYAPKQASAQAYCLLHDPKIIAYLKTLQKKDIKKYDIKKQDVVKGVSEIIDMAVRDKKYNAALRGYELINNMFGFNEAGELKLTGLGDILVDISNEEKFKPK